MQMWREHAPSPILLPLALEVATFPDPWHGSAIFPCPPAANKEATGLKVDQDNGYSGMIFIEPLPYGEFG